MSFAGGQEAKSQPKQRRDEGSPYERCIKAGIHDMQENMRQANAQMERAGTGGKPTRRSSEGMATEAVHKFLGLATEASEETEQQFREWTVATAGEPTERNRTKFSFEKLKRAFDQEVEKIKDLKRQAVTFEQDLLKKPIVECQTQCEEMDNMVGQDEERGLLDDSQMSAQAEELEYTARVAEERESGIRRIQSQVADVSHMLRDLASIVSSQGEQFETIETQAETAAVNTRETVVELQKAANRQRSQRERMCFMLVAVVIVLFFIVAPQIPSSTVKHHNTLSHQT